MAEDLVLQWQNLLRDSVDERHKDVNDLMLLELATKFGAVDPYTKEPTHRLYASLDSIPKAKISEILDGLQANIEKMKIDPMTPIGPIAATSITEPIYQGGMRTFHYAGVLTKKDALSLLDIEVGKTPNKNALVALALPPEKRFDVNYARQLARGLQRSQLSDYCGVIKNHPDLRTMEFTNALEKAKNAVHSFPVDERYEVIEKYSDVLEESILSSGKPTPAFQAVLDEYKEVMDLYSKAAIAAGRMDSYFFYLKTPAMMNPSLTKEELDYALANPNSEEYNSLEKNELRVLGDEPMAALRNILNRQFKSSDGSFRVIGKEDNPLHLLWKNATIEDQTITVNGEKIEGVVLTLPFLTYRLKIGFMETAMRLEYCNGCRAASTLAKLVHKAGRKGKVKVEDESWDTDAPTTEYNQAAIQSILDEAAPMQNPPLSPDELENLQDEAVGLIEIDMSTSDRYDFEIAELGRINRRCGNCGLGWYNTQANVVQFNYGPQYEEYEDKVSPRDVEFDYYQDKDVGLIRDFKFEDLNRQIDIAGHIGSFSDDTVYPDSVGFVSYPGASREGQNSDYPLAFMHGGRLINDPIFDEYYILINYKDVNDGRMNNFKGHFLTASLEPATNQKDLFDFNRTTTNDVRQVELVLGIEAARTQLAHNMFNAQGNGDTLQMAGNSSPVLYKHYLLLADALCNGITMLHARSGSASVTGFASVKGVRTQNRDGELVSYSSVLAQAYERQAEVLLSAAPLGVRDDLRHPMSAQIAGQKDAYGTLGSATRGKYAQVPTKRLFDVKERLSEILDAINDYSRERNDGFSWTGAEDSVLNLVDSGWPGLEEMVDEMYADATFAQMIQQWKITRQELYDLLEEYGLTNA